MLEPCAVKVASTVLRRGVGCEADFLSDNQHVMGREEGLTDVQKNDLEIIKRKYKNIMDIITYDDLIRKIKNIIASY